MTQISVRAKKLIENLLGWSTAPHEGEWEFDEWGRPIGGFAYVDMAQSELEDYIAALEAEVEALRPYRDGFDPQDRLPEVNKYEPDTSVNVDALILTASGVVFWGTLYYHFGKKEWLGIRDNMVILRWYPELPYSESEVRNE